MSSAVNTASEQTVKDCRANDLVIQWLRVITVKKQFIMGHVPWSLVDEVLNRGVLVGLCKAICRRKSEWTPTTDKRKYMREMYALTKFSNILVHSKTQKLDLDKIPKILRSRLYTHLPEFRGLSTLILGSGSGGWVSLSGTKQKIQ